MSDSLPSTPIESPELVLGLVLPSAMGAAALDDLAASLPAVLSEQYAGARWRVSVAMESPMATPTESLELLETARDRMLDEDWDLTVVLTDRPLRSGRKPVLTLTSPVHRVGLIALPGQGAPGTRPDHRQAIVRTVGKLVGWDPDDVDSADDLARLARQISEDVIDRAGENAVQFTGRVVKGNARLLVSLIVENRPWMLALTLSRALAAAAAAGVITLVTSDLWLLAASYGPVRLSILVLLAVGAVSITLIVGAGLWERPRRRPEREQVTLFNLATTATVVIGVLTFHLALFMLSLLGAALLVDAGVFSEIIGYPVGVLEYAKLSLLVAALATVGGALGAGLESHEVVRSAAFTRDEGEGPGIVA